MENANTLKYETGKGGFGQRGDNTQKGTPPTLSNCLKIKNSRKFHILIFLHFPFLL
jgi:hypothetical protein